MTGADHAADLALFLLSSAAYTSASVTRTNSGVVYLVNETGDTLDIAFKGTDPADWRDVARDLSAWPKWLVNHPVLGECHRGFIEGALSALPALIALIESRNKHFRITGHSLGGAEAIAAVALLKDHGLIASRLTTFGAPRVGMVLGPWLASIEGNRYRCGDDPIPELPPWPFVNDRPWTAIGQPAFDPIDCHMLDHYQPALLAAT